MKEKNELYDEKYYRKLREEYVSDTPWKRNRVANVLELLDGVTLVDILALDLACGIGTFTLELQRKRALAVGVDNAPVAISVAQRLFEERTQQKGRFVSADALSLPFSDETADLIVCADFIEHITGESYELLLRECWRILEPGGHIAIYTPNNRHFLELMMKHDFLLPRDESHIDIKNMERTVTPLRETGFSIRKMYYRPTHIKGLKFIENCFIPLPVIGELFRRRICVLAMKP